MAEVGGIAEGGQGQGATRPPPGASFRELVESVPVVFYVADASGGVLYLSPAFEVISGYSPERLYGNPKGWFDLMHPEDRPRVAQVIAKSRGKGQFEIEYRVMRADGTVRWLAAHSTEILGPGGALQRIVGIATDVTERRALEEQLRQAQRMEAVGQLAGGIAHDFNNLLAVIIANAGLLIQRFGNHDPAAQPLAEIEAAAKHAADLTKKLLGFSRQAMLSVRPVALGQIVKEVVGLLRHTLGPRVDLQVKLAPEPDVVVADLAEMCHVVLNLCLNARDAMPAGGRLTLETGRSIIDAQHAAHVAGASPGAFAYVSVADTGTGIPGEVVGRIFEPFFTTKSVGKGTGLGLAVASGIVEQHQGFIECSTSPTGSRFTIFLPLHEGARVTDQPKPKAPSVTSAPGSETILFVDDELPIRNLANRILGRHGYRVRLASDGAEAIAAFRAEPDAIDLVIVDLTMPHMSGVEVVQLLRELRPAVRVILSTGHIGDEARAVDGLEAVTVLPKPYTVDQLLQTVRRRLDVA